MPLSSVYLILNQIQVFLIMRLPLFYFFHVESIITAILLFAQDAYPNFFFLFPAPEKKAMALGSQPVWRRVLAVLLLPTEHDLSEVLLNSWIFSYTTKVVL